MKAESRNFRFHPSAFILVFSCASHLTPFCSLQSEFFNSLFTFDIAPSAGAKRGFRFELKLKLIATASFDSERAGKNAATRRKGLRYANWLLVYNPGCDRPKLRGKASGEGL
jgi:hypothetical protein